MDWDRFLLEWERESHQILSLVPSESQDNPSVAEDRRTPHFSLPAATNSVDRTQERLGVAFPDDLRSFYCASNGWRLVGMGDMSLAPVEGIVSVAASPIEIRREIREYLEGTTGFFEECDSSGLLLLSGVGRTGFCVADPGANGNWQFGFAELGAPEQKFSDFSSCMKSMRWFCHHYLRSYLDFL